MSVIATLDPALGVLAFNGDDTLALVATTPSPSGLATHFAVINVRNGTVLWRSDGTEELTEFLAQPDGTAFAVFLQAPFDSGRHVAVDVVIVHGDGTSTKIPGRYVNL